MKDITGEEVVDRLPVFVSGNGVDQLLGVPKLTSGTGENTAVAVYFRLGSISSGKMHVFRRNSFKYGQ